MKKKKKDTSKGKPISLHPLSPDEILKGLLETKPPPKKKKPKTTKRRRT